MNVIAESMTNDLTGLASYEDMFAEGECGELLIYLDRTLSDTEIDQIEQQLLDQGVILTKPIACDARVLSIGFQKAMPALVVIAGITIVGVLGWQLLKDIGVIAKWLLIGGALVAGFLLAKNLK